MTYWPHSDPDARGGSRTPTPTARPCPGACNREWRQAETKHAKALEVEEALAELQERPPRPVPGHGVRPVVGEPVWCGKEAQRIARDLLAIPDAYVQLELDKLHGTAAGVEHIGKHHKQAAPASPSPAADEQDAVTRFLTAWEDRIRELRGFTARPVRLAPPSPAWSPWPRPPRSVELIAETSESATVMAAVRFLTAHLDWALAREDTGPDLGAQLLRVAARLRQRTRTDRQRVRKPVPCPRCELKTLVHEGGETYVACENPACGRLLSLDEYDQLAAAVVRQESA